MSEGFIAERFVREGNELCRATYTEELFMMAELAGMHPCTGHQGKRSKGRWIELERWLMQFMPREKAWPSQFSVQWWRWREEHGWQGEDHDS